MQLPSWNEFKESATKFENNIGNLLFSNMIYNLKFTKNNEAFSEVVSAISLLSSPFNIIAESIFDLPLDSIQEKVVKILEFIQSVEKQEEREYNNIANKLNNILGAISDVRILINSERKLQLLKDILSIKDEYTSLRVDILKKEINEASATRKILTDIPVSNGVLDFPKYSNLFSDIIKFSIPRYTIGVFGGWGTGKTTLMKMIKKEIDNDKNSKGKIVTVWFDAWKYEREQFVAVIPFLRVIRLRLEELTASSTQPMVSRWEIVKKGLGRTLISLASSTKLKIGMKNIVEVEFDVAKAIENLKGDDLKGDGSLGDDVTTIYYHATGFLEQSLKELRKDGNGEFRIVVFIDDLDRCAPEQALDILESIKSFLDIEGFVYVIGMNYRSIDTLVKTKFGENATVTGFDYMEKLVQLPFQMPEWTQEDVSSLLKHIRDNELIGSDFRNELIINEKLLVTAVEKNPREVKRFINDIILSKAVFEKPVDKLIVVQALKFRQEWNKFLEFLTPMDTRKEFLNKYKIVNRDIHSLDKFRNDLIKSYPTFFEEDDALRRFLDLGAADVLLDIKDMKEYNRALESVSLSGRDIEKYASAIKSIFSSRDHSNTIQRADLKDR